MTRIISCFFLLLSLVGTACNSITVTSQPSSTTRPVMTVTSGTSNMPTTATVFAGEQAQVINTTSPLTEIPTSPAQDAAESQPANAFFDPQIIASADIQDVWWSPDANTLYYGVLIEGNFAYHVESGIVSNPSLGEILRQTPQPEILAQLPPTYRTPFISPDGSRAIYIRLTDGPPSPTFDPEIEGGEITSDSHLLEMWLWDNGSSRSLGKIRQCWLDEHFWSADEGKVVLIESGIPMILCNGLEAQAWLIDLRTLKPHPLFAPSQFPPLQIYGFSPSGNRLLVGFFSDESGANLHLLDTNTLALTPLRAPVNWAIQWLDEHRILVEYRGDLLSPPYPIGILDLQSIEFTELLPQFNDLFVRNVKVSPNNIWMAFTTGRDPFSQDNLWLMKLPWLKS